MRPLPMTLLHDISELAALRDPVVLAAGMFDGLHLGHRQVIAAAQARAAEVRGVVVVLTFVPHPMRVLRPDQPLKLLCSPEHQLLLLERLGVEVVLHCRFDATFASQDAAQFVVALRAACPRLDSIFVGETWRFGARRAGDLALLRALGAEHHFAANGIPQVFGAGRPVSSTRVRQALEAGDLAAARILLGRDHSVYGLVVPGRKLGRTLQFPTANVQVQNEQLPPCGVYAVRALVDQSWINGVANLGHRPTIEGGDPAPVLEVHLFDFDSDLYGRMIEVSFVKMLRSEQKFANLDELRAQIARDCEAARMSLEQAVD